MCAVKYSREMEKKEFKFLILEVPYLKDNFKSFLDLKALNGDVVNDFENFRDITVTSFYSQPLYLVSFVLGLDNVCVDIPGIPIERTVNIVRRSEITNILSIKKHFNCPNFYFANNPGDIIYDLDPEKNYIYKLFYTARGKGKIYFSPNDTDVIDAFIYAYKSKSGDILRNYEHSIKDEEKSVFPHDAFFIMEDIGYEGIKEYRVTLTYSNHYYIQSREGYHGLSKEDRVFENLTKPIDEDIIPKNDMKEILTRFRKIMVELDTPFMSFDLYVRLDEDKTNFFSRYGCFECSIEFGHSLEYSKQVELRKAMTLSLYEFCKNKENKITDNFKREFTQLIN